jgi:DNA adenine methylase
VPVAQTPRPWCRSVLRWAGSKRTLLPTLLSLVGGAHGRYIEPFCGSAALFFALRPSAAILGDTNRDLMETYAVLRRHPRQLHRAVTAHERSDYYRIRALDPSQLGSLERAARFLFLNRNCFNAVYRTNRKGHFNVPLGVRTGQVPSVREFYRCSIALRSANTICADFAATLASVRTGDVVYLDPPYDLATRQRHGEYGYGSFGRGDVTRLAAAIRAIVTRRAYFILSYFDDDAVRQEFQAFPTFSIRVSRHVAGFARGRRPARELLITNIRAANMGR